MFDSLFHSKTPTQKERSIYIPFKDGDPMDFQSYRGQTGIKRRIDIRIKTMQRGETFKALFYSPAGQGKTALVRVLTAEMFRSGLVDNYVEVIATKFDNKADIDMFIRKIPPHTLVFIDEIHGLGAGARDALYPAIQDGVYNFNDSPNMVPLVPGISWLGATTDLGRVHMAMQRRLIPMQLEPLTQEDLTAIATSQPFPVDRDAAMEMAKRCWTPWEIKDEVYTTARDLTKIEGQHVVTLDKVEEACVLLGIDRNGLRPRDRRVLECLYNSPRPLKREVVYALSRGALVGMSGVDDPTFAGAIEPKLMKLGYITIRSVGRALTDKALEEYFGNARETYNNQSPASV